MITNREEVIDKAFKVFLKMNYEKASISHAGESLRSGKDRGGVLFSPQTRPVHGGGRQVCHTNADAVQ